MGPLSEISKSQTTKPAKRYKLRKSNIKIKELFFCVPLDKRTGFKFWLMLI